MEIQPKRILERDIYKTILNSKFELIVYYLLLKNNNTQEFSLNKKVFNIENDTTAIQSKYNFIEKEIYESLIIKQIYLTENTPETKAILKKEIENQLKNKRMKEKITESDIEWILKDNQRQCYYILFMIVFCDDINTLIHQAYNYHEYVIEGKIINKKCSEQYKLMFCHFKPTVIHNLETIYEHIILYFISLDKNKAITQLDFLKSAWSNALKNNNHNWIDKSNEDQIDWIIEYYRKNNIEFWFINNEDLDSKYHTCISILDLWQKNEHISKIGSKDYFLEKMKRSWSQQKYRLSVKDKKSINLRVDKEIEKKINKLCTDLKLTKSQLIELLLKNKQI